MRTGGIKAGNSGGNSSEYREFWRVFRAGLVRAVISTFLEQ